MNIKDFIKIWTKDGARLVEHDRQVRNGFLWVLYGVYFEESREGYGRHLALLLKVAERTEEILAHDIRNITDETVHREVDWFLSHVKEYSEDKEVPCVLKKARLSYQRKASAEKATA